MIIVSLFEGLGNQMFQYATARHLAEKHSTILKLDVSFFELNKRRKYGLQCFNVQEHLATQNEIDRFLNRPRNKIDRLFKNVVNKIGFGIRADENLFQEKFFHFDPNILEAPNHIYLHGFWQSENYFAEIRDVLLDEFSIKYPQDAQNKGLSEKIEFHQSISLHIRRGDYVQNDQANQFHGTCSLEYYRRCIDHINKRINEPHFFVFSDDPGWAKENLDSNLPITIVENNKFRGYEDLRLMSQCKHNIISNSSFSWWGAWLNSNPDKIVCAPEQWFKNKSTDTRYLLPKNFIPWYEDDFVDIKDLLPKDYIRL